MLLENQQAAQAKATRGLPKSGKLKMVSRLIRLQPATANFAF
jgi:hypothetical protein